VAEPVQIADPKTAAVFANRRRVRILLALAGRERSLGELASSTGEQMSLLHHHVGALVKAGLVTVTREQARAGRPIRFYRATADAYFVPAEFAAMFPAQGLAEEMRQALERSRMKTLKGVLYASDQGKATIRLVVENPEKSGSWEKWFDLRLSEADAAAMIGELDAVLQKYAARRAPGEGRYIIHAAIASA
jgi:DNA-binding transcriptional ArsR family regulator